MLCYSIGCRNSFENIEFRWIPEIKHYCPNTPILLVACKTGYHVCFSFLQDNLLAKSNQHDPFTLKRSLVYSSCKPWYACNIISLELKAQWTFLITCCPLAAHLWTFLLFVLFLGNHWASFNKTWTFKHLWVKKILVCSPSSNEWFFSNYWNSFKFHNFPIKLKSFDCSNHNKNSTNYFVLQCTSIIVILYFLYFNLLQENSVVKTLF